MRETLTYFLEVEDIVSFWINPTTTSLSGLFGGRDGVNFSQGLATAVMPRPRAHGSWIDSPWSEGMLGTFKLVNTGTLAQRKTQMEDLQKLIFAAMDSSVDGATIYWNPSGSSPLDVTDIDSTTRMITGLRPITNTTWGMESGAMKNVAFALQSEKPYAESAQLTNYDTTALTAAGSGWSVPLTVPVTLVASGGGTIGVPNAGTADHYPIMQVYGPINTPTITNILRDERLVFSGSIAAGDYWEIDLFERTVFLGGTTQNMIGSLDLAQSTWFPIQAVNGTQTMQLTGSGYTSQTKLRIIQRNGWT